MTLNYFIGFDTATSAVKGITSDTNVPLVRVQQRALP